VKHVHAVEVPQAAGGFIGRAGRGHVAALVNAACVSYFGTVREPFGNAQSLNVADDVGSPDEVEA
jgi:hypothetical protein